MSTVNPLKNLHALSSLYTGKTSNVYTRPSFTTSTEVEIPSSSEVTPNSHCAILLSIYDAIICLKSRVIKSNCLDRTFTLVNKEKYASANWTKRRAFKWDRFIAKAIVRFGEWWAGLDDDTSWDKDNLPPLDVLMVWIAYMMHPDVYRRDCQASGKINLWSYGLPWPQIHAAIDLKTSSYNADSTVLPDLLNQLMAFKSFTPEELTSMAIDQPTTFAPPGKQPGVSIDLYIATRHHDLFAEKMCHLLWLRSPTFSSTLARARDRWGRFLELEEEGMVPAVDIELVWRARLCVPSLYYKIPMSETTRKRVKVSERTLKGETGETAKVWQRKYLEDYERCFCWDCEALLTTQEDGMKDDEGLEEVVQRVINRVGFYRAKERTRRTEVPAKPPST